MSDSRQGSTEKNTLRRIPIVATITAALLFGLAAPAAADAPIEFTEQVTFQDINPCDAPNMHEITISFNFKIHEHRNNTVVVVDSTTSTDDGFSGRGHQTTVSTKQNFLSVINFVQTNPDTGEKFTVKGSLKVIDGDVKVDNFTTRCVRDF